MKGMAMRHLLLLVALGASACDGAPEKQASAPSPAAPPEITKTEAAQSKAPLVLPMPKDQKQLDRLILAGYTPHGNHLHPPGVKNCPLAKEGNDAVM
jgi:hypothetical protein